MTLIEYPEIEQRSEAWYEQRRGLVTASAVGQLITAKTFKVASNDHSRGLTAQLVAERITGWTDPTFMSDDMFRGVDHEPKAVEVYSKHYGIPVTTVGFMVREFENGNRLGYSPDGLVEDAGLLEVKCPRAKTQLSTILANKVPDQHMAQCQAGLLVSGRDYLDFVSFCAGMPLFRKRVEPDQLWQDAIIAALDAFEENAAEMTALYETATEGLAQTERIDLDALVI